MPVATRTDAELQRRCLPLGRSTALPRHETQAEIAGIREDQRLDRKERLALAARLDRLVNSPGGELPSIWPS